MAYFKTAISSGELQFHGDLKCFEEDKTFLQQLIDCCYSIDWVVYAKPPFGGPAAVVKYLGRYTHRIAVANSRIIALSDTHVTFRWKDYADNNRSKEMTLTIGEFIRKFLLHVLPKGFVRIRYFGFLGMRIRKKSLQFCRDQLSTIQETAEQETDDCEATIIESITKVSSFKCPHCGSGRMQRYREFLKGKPIYSKTAA